ncbi:MAG: hypothetical protein LBT01_06925 [Spirochaetaceae bacterium]|nr:hypothetical protein [Spirochaetaceae bacterium]
MADTRIIPCNHRSISNFSMLRIVHDSSNDGFDYTGRDFFAWYFLNYSYNKTFLVIIPAI